MRRANPRASDYERQNPRGLASEGRDRMKPISLYQPSSIEEAIQILSLHGTQAGVYAGGTDLLIQLKNRIDAAPTGLVDIKKMDGLRETKGEGQGGVQVEPRTQLAEPAQ